LVERQEQWAKEEEIRRLNSADPDCPRGMIRLDEQERIQTLEILQKNILFIYFLFLDPNLQFVTILVSLTAFFCFLFFVFLFFTSGRSPSPNELITFAH
jgi:sensor histidine kinase YesM